MKIIVKKIHIVFLIFLFLIIFHTWFLSTTISGYDNLYFYTERLREFIFIPPAWDGTFGNGLGQNIIQLFWVETYQRTIVTVFSTILHLPWEAVERIGWFFPYIILGIFSPYYFLSSLNIFKKNQFGLVIGVIVYSLNTYILMIIAGGQMNIALAYAISPLVLLRFIKSRENFQEKIKLRTKDILLTGTLLAILIMLDLRLFLLLLLALSLYFFIDLINTPQFKLHLQQLVWLFIFPIMIALCIHMYWIFPLIISQQNPIKDSGASYNSINAVSYFSFAKLENSISLLHPNWPENIFGKVSFMKPEFIFLPILAYASLLFIRKREEEKRNKQIIAYFALLGLIGTFLSKGANEPGRIIFLWLFQHIPGFQLFRDPTKFYLFISLSYMVLIPYSAVALLNWIHPKVKKIFIIGIIFYILFLIRPAVTSQLNGTLQPHTIPEEYILLEKFLAPQKNFSRTLWIPMRQRFGFWTSNHPAVHAQDFFQIYKPEDLLKKIGDEKTRKILQEASIKYVIVPIDSEKEIFIKDSKYSVQERNNTIDQLKRISWLTRVNQFKQLAVFEINNSKDHFWSPESKLKMNVIRNTFTDYMIEVANAKKGDRLIMSEKYDQNWIMKNTEGTMKSTQYDKSFNSFTLTRNGSYMIEIYYNPQEWVNWGEIISGIVLIVVITFIIILRN